MLGELHSRRSADIGLLGSFFIGFYLHVYTLLSQAIQLACRDFRAQIDWDLFQVLSLDICSDSGWRGKYSLKNGNWASFSSYCVYIKSVTYTENLETFWTVLFSLFLLTFYKFDVFQMIVIFSNIRAWFSLCSRKPTYCVTKKQIPSIWKH